MPRLPLSLIASTASAVPDCYFLSRKPADAGTTFPSLSNTKRIRFLCRHIFLFLKFFLFFHCNFLCSKLRPADSSCTVIFFTFFPANTASCAAAGTGTRCYTQRSPARKQAAYFSVSYFILLAFLSYFIITLFNRKKQGISQILHLECHLTLAQKKAAVPPVNRQTQQPLKLLI